MQLSVDIWFITCWLQFLLQVSPEVSSSSVKIFMLIKFGVNSDVVCACSMAYLCLCQNNHKGMCLQCDKNFRRPANVHWIERMSSETYSRAACMWHDFAIFTKDLSFSLVLMFRSHVMICPCGENNLAAVAGGVSLKNS